VWEVPVSSHANLSFKNMHRGIEALGVDLAALMSQHLYICVAGNVRFANKRSHSEQLWEWHGIHLG